MEVYGFGLGVGAACLAGGVIGRTLARRRGISLDEWWRLVTGLMVWGMIGGRLAYVLPHAGYYLAHPVEIVRPPIEGYSYYGAIALGAWYTVRFARRLDRNFGFVADLVAQPWLLALLVGALIWGVPVVKAGAPSGLILAADIVYLTVLYGLLGWIGQMQRLALGSGRLAMLVLAVDSCLRLAAGLIFSPFLPAASDDQTVNHVMRTVAAVVGIAGTIRSGGVTVRFAPEGGPSALSRWLGWILVYFGLIGFKVLTH